MDSTISQSDSKSAPSLEAYRDKRSAERTPEPFGGRRAAGSGIFVVQMHAARNLHYDFRVELGGVLRSWAVPRGPSPNPADKRLAVQVEDHPLEYAAFEGVIPEGNYGAGAVIVWDRGTWRPIGDPQAGLEKGKLLFELRGYKLRGKWTLVKTRRGEKDWLFIKERDAQVSEAGTEGYPADSVLSGLTVAELASGEDRTPAIERRLRRLRAPRQRVAAARIKPMLAQPGRAFSDPGWVFEIKYDGYRLVVGHQPGSAQLFSRNGHDLTAVFPEVAEAVSHLPYAHLVLDGEVVVHGEDGLPSFSRLQRRGRLTRRADIARAAVELPATLYVFDLLGFGDHDLRRLPLGTRKALLREVLPSVGPLRFSEHVEAAGESMYAQVRELGLEGMVAKRADSGYRAGRSADWRKIALRQDDDFAVAGYSDPRGAQSGPGALLLGQYAGSELVYTGRVGSGLGARELATLEARLAELPGAKPPANAPAVPGVHWVRPELVCTVRFKERTPEGMLRQPVFQHLREDKAARECLLHSDAPPAPEIDEAAPRAAPKELQLSNLDKVFWPAEGYTKGDLIGYYRDIAPWLLPYLADRPLVMTRFPDGIEGKSFFQKDAPGFAPEWVRTETMWSEDAEREIRYFVVDNVESLLYVINMGTIPLHVWSSRVAALERPDWCILDLDPKGAPFAHVIEIAKFIHRLCDDIGLPNLVKTSGSSGLHVLIPLGAGHTYEQSRNLAQLLAYVTAARLPEIATITRAVTRREGKVYVDYLQNGHGRLLVSAFSARPLPGAPVSMPLRWREVNAKLDITRYTIRNAAARMRRLGADPLAEVLTLEPDIAGALERLGSLL